MSLEEYLSATISTCGTCGRLLPARVHRKGDGIWFHKDCPEHGPQEDRVSSDAEHYLNQGRFHRAGSVPLEFTAPAGAGCPRATGEIFAGTTSVLAIPPCTITIEAYFVRRTLRRYPGFHPRYGSLPRP